MKDFLRADFMNSLYRAGDEGEATDAVEALCSTLGSSGANPAARLVEDDGLKEMKLSRDAAARLCSIGRLRFRTNPSVFCILNIIEGVRGVRGLASSSFFGLSGHSVSAKGSMLRKEGRDSSDNKLLCRTAWLLASSMFNASSWQLLCDRSDVESGELDLREPPRCTMHGLPE